MVGLGRLELPTSPLSGARSSHLSYRPNESRNTANEILPSPEGKCLTAGVLSSDVCSFGNKRHRERDSFHFIGGNSAFAVFFRKFLARSAARSFPDSISSTASEGAIQLLVFTL